VSTALVDELERVSQALTDNIRMVDPTIAELMAIKEASYVVRDAAGLERNQIQLAMAAKAVTPELKARDGGAAGKVDAGWHLLRNLANRKGVPEPILAAVKAANEGYFRHLRQAADRDREGPRDGAAAPLSMRNSSMRRTRPSMCSSRSRTPRWTRPSPTPRRDRWKRDECPASMRIAAHLPGTGSGSVPGRAAAHCAADRADLVGDEARRAGDLSTEVPFSDRSDEVGMLAEALTAFKDNALVAQRIAAEQASERQTKEARAQQVEELTRRFEAHVGRLVQALAGRRLRCTRRPSR